MITDVPGVLVGHHGGCTVVRVPDGAACAVDQRGGPSGTREVDLLRPENLVQRVNAICVSGGGAHGLAAADGVMRWLGERNLGFPVGASAHEVVPIVPAAVLFDDAHGLDASFGYAACEAATDGPVVQGTVGAGVGARVGSLKGGVGSASETLDGFVVGALAVVHAAGEAVDFETGRPFAAELRSDWPDRPVGAAATRRDSGATIGVIAVDAALSKAECRRLAVAGQDGIARAIRPAHTLFDGDTVFALATGARELSLVAGPRAHLLDALCSASARVFARAIMHALLSASSTADVPSYQDLWPETC